MIQMPKKGVQTWVYVHIYNIDGTAVTTLPNAPSVRLSKDGGAYTTHGNGPVHINNGWWAVFMNASDVNANTALLFVDPTSSNANYRCNPSVMIMDRTDAILDAVKGAGFSSTTDAIHPLKIAIQNTLTPIVRDD